MSFLLGNYSDRNVIRKKLSKNIRGEFFDQK